MVAPSECSEEEEEWGKGWGEEAAKSSANVASLTADWTWGRLPGMNLCHGYLSIRSAP